MTAMNELVEPVIGNDEADIEELSRPIVVASPQNVMNESIMENNPPSNYHDTSELHLTEKLTFSSDGSDSEPEEIFRNKKNITKRSTKLIDSDSEDESKPNLVDQTLMDHAELSCSSLPEISQQIHEIPSLKPFKLIDTDSEEDFIESNDKKKDSTSESNSNESDNNETSNDFKKQKKHLKKRRDLNKAKQVSMDGSSSENESDNEIEKTATNKTKPPQRISAKEAEEQMRIIQSESQRMAREIHISVPYHRPKQHSLAEFLNRKIINKPVPMANRQKAAAAIKMTKEELEKFAKHLDERAKESQEFFKSESDEETDLNEVEKTPLPMPEKPMPESAVSLNSPPQNDKLDSAMDKCEPVEEIIINQDIISELEIETPLKTSEEEVNESSILNMEHPQIPIVDEPVSKVESPQAMTIEKPQPKIPIDYDFGNEDELSTKSKVEKLIELMPEINDIVPSIHGDRNCVIDLESGDILPQQKNGIDELFDRFLKHQTKKTKKDTTEISLLSTRNGVVEVEKIKINCDEDDVIIKDSKPRAPFFKLKEILCETMAQKRKEEIERKAAETNAMIGADELEEYSDCNMNNDENDDDDDEEIEDSNSEKEDNKPEEDPSIKDDDSVIDNGQQQHSDTEDDDLLDDTESNDNKEDNLDKWINGQQKQRKRVIMLADSDEEDDRKQNNTLNDITSPSTVLITDELPLNPLSPKDSNGLYSQETDHVTDTQLYQLCSGTFSTQLPNLSDDTEESEPIKLIFESSDDEEMDTVNAEKPKSTKRKAKQLGFSDDEDEDANNEAEVNDGIEDVAELEKNDEVPKLKKNDEVPEENDEELIEDCDVETRTDIMRIVEYDSEENEITTEIMKEKRKQAMEYFENEAELSESEWGSADEDEKDLDRYDIELADEEEFDQNQIQNDLGRIHMKRLLDQDKREVKIIQEMLFDDEENDGLGRERQFRWKNVDGNISVDERNINAENTEEAGLLNSDDENEEQWRKMRHERTMLLKENESNVSSMESPQLDNDLNTATKKITVIKSANNTPPISMKNSPFLIGKNVPQMQHTKSSFLSRDQKTLSRLATLTKAAGEDSNEMLMPSAIGKTKNFVFSTLTPSDEKTSKRKIEDNSIEENQKKKTKIVQIRKERLLDILE